MFHITILIKCNIQNRMCIGVKMHFIRIASYRFPPNTKLTHPTHTHTDKSTINRIPTQTKRHTTTRRWSPHSTLTPHSTLHSALTGHSDKSPVPSSFHRSTCHTPHGNLSFIGRSDSQTLHAGSPKNRALTCPSTYACVSVRMSVCVRAYVRVSCPAALVSRARGPRSDRPTD